MASLLMVLKYYY